MARRWPTARKQRNHPGRGRSWVARLAGVCLLATCIPGPTCPYVGATETRFIHVDGVRGRDTPERDGSTGTPFRTITYALLRAGEPDTRDVEIRVKPGTYGDGETFPLATPSGLRRLSVAGDVGVIVDNPSRAVASLDARAYPEPGDLELSLRRITVRGGLSGVSFAGVRGQKLAIIVEQCAFEGQAGRGAEFYLGEGAEGSLEVRETTFGASGGGVGVETGPGARLDLSVEGCAFQDLEPYGPDEILGAGVEVHLDPAAHIHARIERNVFRGVPSAVQLTAAQVQSDVEPSGGSLLTRIVGNLIYGLDATGSPRAKSALYASLWTHHEISLLVASNTFAFLQRHVIYHDNLDLLLGAGRALPLTFVNNVCYGIGGLSEFDLEVADDAFPPAGVIVQNNLMEKSRLGVEGLYGNFCGDPCFVDVSGGDLSLRPESPAVDRGLSEYAHLTVKDVGGSCRRAGTECHLDLAEYPMDLGAYELAGYCDEDTAFFVRGDCGTTGGIPEISDAIFLFTFLFLGGAVPSVPDACDSNDDGAVDLADGVYVLSYLFTGGAEPPPPFQDGGTDPSRDCLASQW